MNEKTINLQIVEFRQQLNQAINSCYLDAGIVYYVVKDIFYEIEKQYNNIIKSEYDEWTSFILPETSPEDNVQEE